MTPQPLEKWTLALINVGLVTMEAQLWAYNLGLPAIFSP